MVILKNFTNIFKIPELSRKFIITLGILIVERIGTFIPVVGVNIVALQQHLAKSADLGNWLGYFDVLSGGALSKSTLFALGIGPYITASIMMQILSMTIPSLEALQKEGENGRRVINQYTRYLATFLAVMYSSIYATYLERSGLVLNPGIGFKLLFVLSLTVGALFVMWLAEQISLFGLGNGSSMIIFGGIVARFPGDVIKTVQAVQNDYISIIKALFIWGIYIAITACIVYLEKGERKVPVQYARRVIGNKVYGGQSSYIPFKINSAGVMPVIFAGQILQLPAFLANMLSGIPFFKTVSEMLTQNGILFNALQFTLIIFFTFFYTALIFNPTELADQMKKNGGFVPGIRPGKKTAEFFENILDRIGLLGAFYLGLLAILPNIIMAVFDPVPFIIGGTSLLIAVGVGLELASQIESYLIEHRYDGFLKSGRMKNSVGR